MSEMVERVAKAMYPQYWEEDASSFYVDMRNATILKVRTGIEAMREPTKGMIVAAMITPYPTTKEAGGIIEQGEAATKLEWQAMIDAALCSPERESQ